MQSGMELYVCRPYATAYVHMDLPIDLPSWLAATLATSISPPKAEMVIARYVNTHRFQVASISSSLQPVMSGLPDLSLDAS